MRRRNQTWDEGNTTENGELIIAVTDGGDGGWRAFRTRGAYRGTA